jgi:hypothetical protein
VVGVGNSFAIVACCVVFWFNTAVGCQAHWAFQAARALRPVWPNGPMGSCLCISFAFSWGRWFATGLLCCVGAIALLLAVTTASIAGSSTLPLQLPGLWWASEGRRGEGGGWRPCQLHVSERCCAVQACQQQSRGQFDDAIVAAAVVPCLTVFVSSLHLPALGVFLSVTRFYVHISTTQVCFDQLKGFRGC